MADLKPINAIELRSPQIRFVAESADQELLLEFMAMHLEAISSNVQVGFFRPGDTQPALPAEPSANPT